MKLWTDKKQQELYENKAGEIEQFCMQRYNIGPETVSLRKAACK